MSDVSNEIIQVSLEILNNFLRIPYDENDADAKALRGLVIRTLDDIRGCRVLAENELGTQILSLSRDFVEIEQLIIYFTIHPDEIGTWYNASQTKREKKYSQGKLRDEIMRKFPDMESSMKSEYRGHSTLTHLNPQLLIRSTAHLPFAIIDVSQHAERIAQRIAFFTYNLDTSKNIEKIKSCIEELTHLDDQLQKIKGPIMRSALKSGIFRKAR